jgi:hypothetical protein
MARRYFAPTGTATKGARVNAKEDRRERKEAKAAARKATHERNLAQGIKGAPIDFATAQGSHAA